MQVKHLLPAHCLVELLQRHATGAEGPSNTNKANRNRKRSKYGVKRPKQ